MTVTVVMTTFVPVSVPERLEYAIESIRSLHEHLKGPWKLHIADDGSNIDDLRTLMHAGGESTTYTNAQRGGIGKSLNLALAQLNTDLWMYTTDDWVLTQDYDLTPAFRIITEAGYDYVRIGHPHPDVGCTIKFQQGLGYWLDMRADNGFAFATRPFLATKRFYDIVGPFTNGENSYTTEINYNSRVGTAWRRGTLKLASVNLRGDEWSHIGEKEVGCYAVGELI